MRKTLEDSVNYVLDKQDIMKEKYKDICPKCSTRNENWLYRRRIAKKEEVVYCWHCGQAVRIAIGKRR